MGESDHLDLAKPRAARKEFSVSSKLQKTFRKFSLDASISLPAVAEVAKEHEARKKKTSLKYSFKKQFRKFSLDASSSQSQPSPILAKCPSHDGPCISTFTDKYSMDCPNCMMVAMGEMTSYKGQQCDNCGRVPRAPYDYF